MTCDLADIEVTKVFDRLASLVGDVYKETKQILDLEIDLSQKALEKQNSQGFWEDLISGDKDFLKDSLANNTAFNPSEVATAGVQFGSIFSTLFGGASVIPSYGTNSSGLLSGKVDGAFDTAYNACNNSVSAAGVVGGIVGIQARKLSTLYNSVTATFGMLVSADDTVAPALFVNTLKNFIVKSTLQNLLLSQIDDEISNINEAIARLTSSDYTINHKTLLSGAIIELRTADNILRAQLDNVLRKFPLNMTGYEQAKEHIDRVKDALCGIDFSDLFGGYLSLDVIKVTARLIYLEELKKLLIATDEDTTAILTNLGSFDTAFENVTFFDDLFVPVLQLLRCRLSVLMGDMKATIDKNKLASFIVKEKAWCLELAILSSIMRAARVFDIDVNKTPLGVSGLDGLMDKLFLTVKDQNYVVSIDSVVATIDQYTSNVQYKLSFNVPTRSIQLRGELAQRLIAQRIKENKSFSLLINEQTLSVQGALLSGIAIVGKFLSAISNVDALGGAADEMQKGNMSGLFNGEVLSKTIKQSYEDVVASLEKALKSAKCSLTNVADKELSGYSIFEDATRSEALFNESLAGFPETRLREIISGELPKYNVK